MKFDLNRSDVETLLAGFLAGTQCVKLQARVLAIDDLPEECRQPVGAAASLGRAWTAWSTERGPMAAWGNYDIKASIQLNAYVLLVEWYVQPSGCHSIWCHCNPARPTEWVVGRGRVKEAPG